LIKWLKRNKVDEFADFIFETMDYDEPIISFEYVNGDFYRIESIWKETDVVELISKKK